MNRRRSTTRWQARADLVHVLVSDTSIIIDLERGSLLRACFGLPFRFAVPDVLYSRELLEHGGPDLVELGLEIAELDGAGVALAKGIGKSNAGLSLPDCFALALAKVNGWALLTGDGRLRHEADQQAVKCNGLLWLIDQLIHYGGISSQELLVGLTTVGNHPRCRLPRSELKRRIDYLSQDKG